MPRTSAATFDSESAKAIARAVTELRRAKPPRAKTRIRRRTWESGAGTAWIRITGSSPISANRWLYSGSLVAYNDSTDTWDDVLDNASQPITYGDILNTMEHYNAATGFQGNGINVGSLPPGFSISPLSNGTPVLPLYTIGSIHAVSMANGIIGACP